MEKITEDFLNELLTSDSLSGFLENESEFISYSLPEYLDELLSQKGLKKSQVIQNSGLSSTFAYQIFSGERNPSRNKLLQLAFAMGMTLNETQRLLKISGANELYCKNRRDVIIIYCINKGYNLDTVEETLQSFDEDTIISYE